MHILSAQLKLFWHMLTCSHHPDPDTEYLHPMKGLPTAHLFLGVSAILPSVLIDPFAYFWTLYKRNAKGDHLMSAPSMQHFDCKGHPFVTGAAVFLFFMEWIFHCLSPTVQIYPCIHSIGMGLLGWVVSRFWLLEMLLLSTFMYSPS